MAGMAPGCEGKTPGGEGNSVLLRSPSLPLSPLDPHVLYLIECFGTDKIHDIMNCDGKTFEQKIDHLREELRAFELARESSRYPPHFEDEDDESEDEGEGVDEADEKIVKLLGDEKKPGIVKRPQSPIEGELECKKPKIAEDSRCEEPQAGGTKNSSQ